MSLVSLIAVLMIFSIPILGILLSGYKEWLEFKSKHQELGTSAREIDDRLRALRDRLADLEEERDALRDRVQNLETIITSEAWITGHEETDATSLDAAEADALTLPPDRESSRSDAEHTAEIARRLRGQ
jgi:predicted nuclease with TOPRIM domain